ncbi:MAG: hypothetical protein QOD81_4053 [Solirubrobacteraceae bacterium]|jgi:hypothetical protein|nr:hypothetical protein [Solirubrobacteraceae bacterium]
MRLWVALVLAVAVTAVLAGAADGGGRPHAHASAGDSLQLVGTPQIDRTGILLAAKWTSITASGATWDTDGWRGEFSWSIPSSIPPGGAPASVTVTATDKNGGRYNGVIGATGNLFIEGGPAVAEALADKVAGPATKSATKSFRLVPGSYCDTCPISVTVGIQDGPRITFNYKVVPKQKPCPGRQRITLAQAKGPLVCNTNEPGPGESIKLTSPTLRPKDKEVKVDIGSSAGTLSGTTIVGEAEAKQSRAEKVGEVVAACYFIGSAAFDYPKETIGRALDELVEADQIHMEAAGTPRGRLLICIALARKLVEPAGSSAAAHAAARGCNARRIAIVPQVRRGRIVGLKPAKVQRPSGSSVRYSCAAGADGTAAKLTVRRSQGLRSAIGTRLDLGVVRASNAPERQATLTFKFH